MDLLLDAGRRVRRRRRAGQRSRRRSARRGDPAARRGWRRLTGDEIGWLLADHILRHTTGDDRLVITTLVSSSLLGRMAAAAGVHCAETFTGFKWIGKTSPNIPSCGSCSATSRRSATS